MVKLLALLTALITTVVGSLLWWQDHPEAGRFRVRGSEIIGLDDEPFVPVGVNMLGPDGFFNPDGVTAGHAEVLAEAWKVNTVRLNACLPVHCQYGIHNANNGDLDALVEEYTDAGLVVIIALHQTGSGKWPDDSTLDAMAAWWHDAALRYGDEPLVWFNLVNEPGSDRPADRRWIDLTRTLLRAVRDAGAHNLVVVDGTDWGQEAGGDQTTKVDDDDSAILTFGAELKGDDDAIVFSFHVYDQWAASGADDPERDDRMVDFVNRVHAAGHAVLIGETGSPAAVDSYDARTLATHAAYRVVARTGIGLLAWHGQGIDGYQLVDVGDEASSPSAIDSWDDPTNLTWHGRLLWDLTHRD